MDGDVPRWSYRLDKVSQTMVADYTTVEGCPAVGPCPLLEPIGVSAHLTELVLWTSKALCLAGW